MKEIPLTCGLIALVDDADFEWLRACTWHAKPTRRGKRHYYAATTLPGSWNRAVYMHHLLLPPRAGLLVDHANRNRLDNRRSNLRYATPSQSGANSVHTRVLSPYRGVRPSHRRWMAQISVKNKNCLVGIFDTPEEAARAYDAAVLARWGEFAVLNFPRPEQEKR